MRARRKQNVTYGKSPELGFRDFIVVGCGGGGVFRGFGDGGRGDLFDGVDLSGGGDAAGGCVDIGGGGSGRGDIGGACGGLVGGPW